MYVHFNVRKILCLLAAPFVLLYAATVLVQTDTAKLVEAAKKEGALT